MNVLGQFNRDDSLRMHFYRFSPEFQLRVDAAVKNEVLTVGVKRGNRWMMRYLFAYYSVNGRKDLLSTLEI